MRKCLNLFILSISFALIPSAYGFSLLDGTLSYERFARLNTPAEKNNAVDWFGLSIDTRRFSRQIEYNFQADLRYFAGENDFNYSFPEAYFQYKTANSHTSFGRKLLNWSSHERFWQLGYLNAQRGFRLLDDRQEGATGLHYDFRPHQIGVRFSIFFSYFYIPTLNPSLNIEDGRVSSTSEWRKMPPTETIVNDQRVPIYYMLNDPSVSDIVFQRSLGANLEYSWGSGKVQGYAIYKPEASPRVNADAVFDNDEGRVEVTANPVVNHHVMSGLSIHQRLAGILFSMGADFVDPNARIGKDFDVLSPSELRQEDKTFESEFFTIEPNYERESYGYIKAGVDRYFYHFALHYIHRLNSLNQDGDDFFSDTVKFKSAFGVEAGFWPTERIYLTIDWKYDVSRKDNIFKFESLYRVSHRLTLGVGGEFISAPNDSSYWSAYRTNDTIYAMLNYHF